MGMNAGGFDVDDVRGYLSRAHVGDGKFWEALRLLSLTHEKLVQALENLEYVQGRESCAHAKLATVHTMLDVCEDMATKYPPQFQGGAHWAIESIRAGMAEHDK